MRRRRRVHDLHEALSVAAVRASWVMALGITPKLNGCSLQRPPLYITAAPAPAPEEIVSTVRIGITVGSELPLRFYLKGSRFASRRCIHAPSVSRGKLK